MSIQFCEHRLLIPLAFKFLEKNKNLIKFINFRNFYLFTFHYVESIFQNILLITNALQIEEILIFAHFHEFRAK